MAHELLSVAANHHKVYYDDRGNNVIIATGSMKKAERTGKGNGFIWIEIKKTAYYSVYFSSNRRIENVEDLFTIIKLTIRTGLQEGRCRRRLQRQSSGRASRRGLYRHVIQSVMLYAVLVWIRTLNAARTRRNLGSVQRRIALRTYNAYRRGAKQENEEKLSKREREEKISTEYQVR